MPLPKVSTHTVTSAYIDEHLAVGQLPQRFSIAERAARAIVTETEQPPGIQGATRDRDDNDDALWPPGGVPVSDAGFSLYRQLSDRGINDPGLLERAALIDRAAADVILGASEQLGIGSVGTVTSGQRRSPAQLAAADGAGDLSGALGTDSATVAQRASSRSSKARNANHTARGHTSS